jgi:hypothetical protein
MKSRTSQNPGKEDCIGCQTEEMIFSSGINIE